MEETNNFFSINILLRWAMLNLNLYFHVILGETVMSIAILYLCG